MSISSIDSEEYYEQLKMIMESDGFKLLEEKINKNIASQEEEEDYINMLNEEQVFNYIDECKKEEEKEKKIKERNKKYYEAHKEAKLSYQKEYRQKHKEQISEYTNEYNKQKSECPICHKKLRYGSISGHKRRKHNIEI